MPAPGSRRGRTGRSPLRVERGGQPAAIEQGDEVAAVARRGHAFHHGDGGRLEVDGGAEFQAGHLVKPVAGGLLVANDAARDVPAGAIMAVAAPGQEGAMVLVLNEEVDIDQRGDAAGEEKEVFGEAGARVAGEVLQGLDGFRQGPKGFVKWVRLVNLCVELVTSGGFKIWLRVAPKYTSYLSIPRYHLGNGYLESLMIL